MRPCGVKSLMRRAATLANAANSCAFDWPTFANAHAVLASPCMLNSPVRRFAVLANTVKSCISNWPTVETLATCPGWKRKEPELAVANAHAVLARPCALKSPRRCSATLANLWRQGGTGKRWSYDFEIISILSYLMPSYSISCISCYLMLRMIS